MNSSGKKERHEAIKYILGLFSESTQEEICVRLENMGINASQSSVSRDLREIGAVKIPHPDGKTSYKLSFETAENGENLQGYDVEYEIVGNLLVVKTKPGNAPGFCAELDNRGWEEIVGTIAGDDTILVIGRNDKGIKEIASKLEIMIKKG